MKNINKASYSKAMIIENEEEKLILQEGDKVKITTDNTDYKEVYEGEITMLIVEDTERIEIANNGEMIDFSYILEIEKLS